MTTACDTREAIASPQLTSGVPRSHRVGSKVPAHINLSSLNTTNHSSLPSSNSQRSPNPASPPLPLRSPLRPPARSISSQSSGSNSRLSRDTQDLPETPPPSAIDDSAIIVNSTSSSISFQMREQLQPFPSINELIDTVTASSEDSLISKNLHGRPDSPLSLSLQDGDNESSSLPVISQPTMTKRQHALHELLSSERAYASDLALIREVHIPLALGQTVPLQNVPVSPPGSSSSSSRTVSTSSDSSTVSLGPPMTQDDARVIFSNIAELALFSDLFCEELELALGAVVEGGAGEDHVGELFLRIIPELERPYKHYITRHPTALQHLQGLPQTPALAAYLSYTRTVAASLSHAWDLASLLIKPVQRLLKYPLLLAAIIDETPESHSDKESLKNARCKMEEVARNVNEGRRRAEVIKDVLSSKKKPVNVSVAASVNLGKMKSLRYGGSLKAAYLEENGEAAQVEVMQAELKRIEVFAQQFARNIVDWAKMMSKVVLALRTWSLSFGKVIGLSPDQGSEAFDAFLAVVEQQLMPLCVDLEAIINERLLKEIAHLLKTMNQPLKLLASMSEQEPFHYHLLNMNVSAKNRPPPTLLAASTNYLALRGQLAAELPQYLSLLHKGMAIFVRRLADIKTSFWKDIKDRWGDLWEMLRVEGELNAGYEETMNVWQARWMDVDEVVASLNVNQARKIYQEPERARPAAATVHSTLSSLEPPHVQYIKKGSNVNNMLSSLEPTYAPTNYVSPPYPLTPSVRTRGRGMSGDDTSFTPSRRPIGRRNSNDSMHSSGNKSVKGKSPRRKTDRDEYSDYVPVMSPYVDPSLTTNTAMSQSTSAIPRRKSMPLSSDKSNPGRRGNPSPSRAVIHGYSGEDESLHRGHSQQVQQEHYDNRERERGRVSRNPSTKRKVSDVSKRPTHSRQRSSSITSFDIPASTTVDHDPRPLSSAQRDSWVNKPAKYVCQVVHPCQPPAAVSYFSFPFFTLVEGDLFEVLQEAGHPSIHPKLPLYVDDGEDCLLLCRDGRGNVGWALASFLEPVSLSG